MRGVMVPASRQRRRDAYATRRCRRDDVSTLRAMAATTQRVYAMRDERRDASNMI